ncbi:hypothetical protein like AT4G20970 [Hibiscus trionum]|uniref:BHLH domain-containing protein n=1 Tax=Hibiscus trionum TaxID=183268 RepID=A0A9W7LQ48_HIBTR|nr:hypothetical protein like AT4G20970 [Hibiscus trionum]
MEANNPNSSKLDRKFIERNRRNQMKALCSKLNSLVPHHSSREAASLPDQLDEAANYIKSLKANLERTKEKKERFMGSVKSQETSSKSPQIQIQEMGSSSLVIALNTGFNNRFIFNETIRVLHEERAEIVNASFSSVDEHTVLHTIHLSIGEASADRAARISERLKKLVHDAGACDYLNH